MDNIKLNRLISSFKKYCQNDDSITADNLNFEIEQLYLELDTKDKDYYRGYFDCILDFIRENEFTKIDNMIYEKCISKSQYSIKILEILSDEDIDFINHKDLASKLNINKNQLSNIVNMINSYHVFHIDKIGRNKFYSISQEGKKLLEYSKRLNTNILTSNSKKKFSEVGTTNYKIRKILKKFEFS